MIFSRRPAVVYNQWAAPTNGSWFCMGIWCTSITWCLLTAQRNLVVRYIDNHKNIVWVVTTAAGAEDEQGLLPRRTTSQGCRNVDAIFLLWQLGHEHFPINIYTKITLHVDFPHFVLFFFGLLVPRTSLLDETQSCQRAAAQLGQQTCLRLIILPRFCDR